VATTGRAGSAARTQSAAGAVTTADIQKRPLRHQGNRGGVLLRRGQDKLRNVLPGGNFGGRGMALVALAAVMLWGFSGFFQVALDELGLVMRFGKYVRDAKPGLNYHIPYPVESVEIPKVTRVNRIDIGMRLVEDPRRGTQMRDVPEESLMLTGDENIVDVDFTVFWVVEPEGGASAYRFNIENPEGTVKAVAESAMREVVGRSEIQPILTGALCTSGTVRDEDGNILIYSALHTTPQFVQFD
jgi:membrane protease subunit HflK